MLRTSVATLAVLAVTTAAGLAQDKPSVAFVVNAASDFWKLAETGVSAAHPRPPHSAGGTSSGAASSTSPAAFAAALAATSAAWAAIIAWRVVGVSRLTRPIAPSR